MLAAVWPTDFWDNHLLKAGMKFSLAWKRRQTLRPDFRERLRNRVLPTVVSSATACYFTSLDS